MNLSFPISFPKALTQWFGSKSLDFRVGISLHSKWVRMVKGQIIDDSWHYLCSEEIEIDGEEQWKKVLITLIKRHNLEQAICFLVLPAQRYQMLQIDKPAIPDEEISGALAWAVKDLVAGIAPEDIVADFMHMPAKSPGQGDKLNVIVTNNKTIRPLIAVFHELKVQLGGIIPEELTTRNLIDTDDCASLTLVQQQNEEMILQIIKNEQLFIARKLRGFNRIHQHTVEELEQGVIDNIYLEIQRSMDFFDSQLKQPQVKNVLLALPCVHQDLIIEQFAMHFKVAVSRLIVNHKKVVMDDPLSEQFFPALGGALEYMSQGEVVHES